MGDHNVSSTLQSSEKPNVTTPFMSLMCNGNELFYSMLYLLNFDDGPPVFGLIGMFELLAYVTAPIALAKSGISLVQLVVAVRNIGIIDVAEREAVASKKT